MVAVDAAVFTCIASPWPPTKPPLGSVRSPSLLLVWMFISFAVFVQLDLSYFLWFFEKYLEEPLCIFTSHAWPLAAISHHSSHEFPGSSYAASCDVHILGISAKTAWYFFEIWRQGSQWQKRQINKIRCSQFKTISDFCTMSMRMFTKKRLVSDAFLSFMVVLLGNDYDESYTICLVISSPWESMKLINIRNFIDEFDNFII